MSIKAPFGIFEVSISDNGFSGSISMAFAMFMLAATMILTMFIFYGVKRSRLANIIGYVAFGVSEVGWIGLSVLSIQSAFNVSTHWDLMIIGVVSMLIAVFMLVYVRTYKNRLMDTE